MTRLHFAVVIHASRETVWETMLAPDTYRQWTAEFTEGSHYEGSWEAGARIRFLDPKGFGITSVIVESRRPAFVSIKHLGTITGGIDDTESEAVRQWAPAFENYTFAATGDGTEVRVELDVTPDFESYMMTTWPKALARLKAICEGSSQPA